MALAEVLTTGNEACLRRAAVAGSRDAQLKLAAWLLICSGASDDSRASLRFAADAGNAVALHGLSRLDELGSEHISTDLLTSHGGHSRSTVADLTLIAAREALRRDDLQTAMRCLLSAVALSPSITTEVADITLGVVHLAEESRGPLSGIPVAFIESCLQSASDRGKRHANYLLGRALCGISSGLLAASDLTEHSNIRKGSALLLRAADSGINEAWLHLYRLHSERRSSIANVPMARVFLEKAARQGSHEAQRVLGALLMSESGDLRKAEDAVNWLFLASRGGDNHAASLLASLVAPPTGDDGEANAVLEELKRHDPLMASRLHLSRHFGLTKREALTVTPATGKRPWGLVVGRNPFIVQSRLSAPRAVPGLSEAALSALHSAASMFEQAGQDADAIEGDLRRRAVRLSRAVRQERIKESMFFAEIPADALEAMRCGPKWAFRCRRMLRTALAT